MHNYSYQDSKYIVNKALQRISNYIHKTPIVKSESLDNITGHKIVFKAESLQKTGAFKVRGVLNHLLHVKENGQLPQKVVAYSTGNHGIGVAFACKKLGIKARIYLPQDTALLKQQQCMHLNAEVIFTKTRKEAEEKALDDSTNGDFYYLHPSDSQQTIAGAGTVCLEALNQIDKKIDAIFASCGGGGLLSGCYLAKEEFEQTPQPLIIGAEPECANDAYLSIHQNKIYKFENSPNTIADGLKTLNISERTFKYLNKLDDFITISEDEIKYWTIWLIHLLKIMVEPSCAISMAAAYQWLKKQNEPKNILVILSGGNIDPQVLSALLNNNYLMSEPRL